jgi:hypothetical protein
MIVVYNPRAREIGMRRLAMCGCLLAIVIPTVPLQAQGYMDPGTGSILIQVLLAGTAGLAAILKLYWGRIRAVLGSRKKAPLDGD